MISNNYNMYELYTPFINQVFNLLHRSRLPAMNICTTDVALGWMYRWFSFDGRGDSIIATNDIGNMIYINLANIVNTTYEYPESFETLTTLLTAITHELSHMEQDIDPYKYGRDNKNYTDMIENANQFRTVKFLLEHKEFIENNIHFGGKPLKINESQLLSEYNELKFAENDFVHKEKIKSIFYKLNVLNFKRPDDIQLIKDIKNFSIKDINGHEAVIKRNGRYIANYEDLWILNSIIYQIYHRVAHISDNNWLADVQFSNDENTLVLIYKISV